MRPKKTGVYATSSDIVDDGQSEVASVGNQRRDELAEAVRRCHRKSDPGLYRSGRIVSASGLDPSE